MVNAEIDFGYRRIGCIKLFTQIFAFYLFIFLFFVQTPIKEKKNRTKKEKKDGFFLMLLLKLISQNVQNEQS